MPGGADHEPVRRAVGQIGRQLHAAGQRVTAFHGAAAGTSPPRSLRCERPGERQRRDRGPGVHRCHAASFQEDDAVAAGPGRNSALGLRLCRGRARSPLAARSTGRYLTAPRADRARPGPGQLLIVADPSRDEVRGGFRDGGDPRRLVGDAPVGASPEAVGRAGIRRREPRGLVGPSIDDAVAEAGLVADDAPGDPTRATEQRRDPLPGRAGTSTRRSAPPEGGGQRP